VSQSDLVTCGLSKPQRPYAVRERGGGFPDGPPRGKMSPLGGQRPHAVRERGGHQSGAAILTAMLVVTLIATLTVAALWQQWRSLEIEAAQRARAQSGWILVGALDWARLILREDARSGGADHLAEPWAVPLEEARLATFFAADNTTDTSLNDAQQSFISGQIIDMQGRLNVRNLVGADNKVSAVAVRQFARLFGLLGLPETQVPPMAENLRRALDNSTPTSEGEPVPLAPARVEQLVWLGLSPQTIAVLAPFVTILPHSTPVNLNTAPAEVILASIDGSDMAVARRLVSTRALSHFKTLNEVAQLLGDVPGQIAQENHSVSSRYFEVRGKLRLDELAVLERSLVARDGLDVKVLWRERSADGPAAKPSLQ
jgi:general secretion pathway protein K